MKPSESRPWVVKRSRRWLVVVMQQRRSGPYAVAVHACHDWTCALRYARQWAGFYRAWTVPAGYTPNGAVEP